MKQSSITGGWSQEYVPDKTRSVRDWLNAANHGEAFKGKKNVSPDTLKMNKPTPEMQRKSDEAKKKRQQEKWELIFFREETRVSSKTKRIKQVGKKLTPQYYVQ